MPTVNSSHITSVAIHYEQTIAQPPGYVATTAPAGTAAGWAGDEGTNTDRVRVLEADPSFLQQSAIEDNRLKSRVFAKDVPIFGLRNADGGSIQVVLHGAEVETSAASQVAETGLMRILKHGLGGLQRGNTTAVAAAPSSDVSFDVDAATNIVEGALIAVADADDSERLYPARVLTVSGASLTTDQDLPFAAVIAENDEVHAVATAYIDQDALVNPADANATTVSFLIEKGSNVWAGVGGALQIDSLEFPRHDQPRINVSLMAAAAYPPGDLAPTSPTWTGTITGDPGLSVGADTKMYVQDKGTTTVNCVDVLGSVKVTLGVPKVPIDTVTECDAGMQGRAGYTTRPGDTIIEFNVLIDSANQDDWDTTTAKTVRYFQVGPPGSCWAVVAPNCYLMESPKFGDENESVVQTLRYICHEDESYSTDTELTRSKILIGLY